MLSIFVRNLNRNRKENLKTLRIRKKLYSEWPRNTACAVISIRSRISKQNIPRSAVILAAIY